MSEFEYDEYKDRPELKRLAQRADAWATALKWLAGCVAFILISISGANAIASFSTRHALLDCTQPTGHCFKQGQARTSQFIIDLKHSIALQLACQDKLGVDTVSTIEVCVRQALEKERGNQ